MGAVAATPLVLAGLTEVALAVSARLLFGAATTDIVAGGTVAAGALGRMRVPWSYGDTGGGRGSTDLFGNILIQPGLVGQALWETIRHESVHRFFSPLAGSLLRTGRAMFGNWAYQNISLVQYLEEALAEGYATRSLLQGLAFPIRYGYVTLPRVLGGAAVFGGAIWSGISYGSGWVDGWLFGSSEK